MKTIQPLDASVRYVIAAFVLLAIAVFFYAFTHGLSDFIVWLSSANSQARLYKL